MSYWENLRADPLFWLLDERQPNLLWRVLVELLERPAASPAVRRAQAGASAVEPVASLLERLAPDGSWMTRTRMWTPYGGTGWRVVAATAWGADPEDPRLGVAAARFLLDAPGEGGFSPQPGQPASPPLTGRVLQAMARLGRLRHPRCQEALAWLEEEVGDPDPVTAVAVLAALAEGCELRRSVLGERAVAVLLGRLERPAARPRYGHPNLLRTDRLEQLRALALARVPFDRRMAAALAKVQRMQDEEGIWSLGVIPPASLSPGGGLPRAGQPSGWVTLSALVVISRYGEAAGLPRLFPSRPSTQ